MRKSIQVLSTVIKPLIVTYGVFLVSMAILSVFNRTLTGHVINTLAGIWSGIASTFIMYPYFDPKSYNYKRVQDFRIRHNNLSNRSIKLIFFGMALFFTGGLFGSGHMFGIDFTGLCPSGNFEASLGELVEGKVYLVVIFGALVGVYLDSSVTCYDFYRFYDSRLLEGFALVCGFGSIFFSYQFSRAFGSSYIVASVISAIGTTIWLMRMKRKAATDTQNQPITAENDWRSRYSQILLKYLVPQIDLKRLYMFVFSVGLLIIPVGAYLSNAMTVCSR